MIYLVRRHDEASKLRDVSFGAFSTFNKALECIREDMLENGFYEDAMKLVVPEGNVNPFEIIHGITASSIRYPFGNSPFFRYYDVKTTTFDGE